MSKLGSTNPASTKKSSSPMVTTRRRRAALALSPVENRLDSSSSSAGPFTLNKTDPKVSVSAARVDRTGLHVSLTIPLETSVVHRTAPSSKSKPARKEIGELELPANPNSPIPRGTEGHRVTIVAQNAEQPLQSGSQRIPKSGRAGTLGPVKRNGGTRNRSTPSGVPKEPNVGDVGTAPWPPGSRALSTSPVREVGMQNNSADAIDGSENIDDRWPAPASRPPNIRANKRLHDSSVLVSPGQAETIGTVDDLRCLPSAGKVPHHGMPTGSGMVEPTKKRLCPGKLKLLKDAVCTRRNSSAGGFSSRRTGEWEAATASTQKSSYIWLPNALINFFRIKNRHVACHGSSAGFSSSHYISLASVAIQCTAFALLGASCMIYFRWIDVNSFTAALWAGWHLICAPTRSFHSEWQAGGGMFYVPDASEVQQHCSKLGDSCHDAHGVLCGYPLELPSSSCLTLGRDIAAKKNGGSIDYAQTSGGVSHWALLISQLLEKVASFGMPTLTYEVYLNSLPFSNSSNLAMAKLLQSYYPLYDHTNDPGALVSDSNATYVIPEKRGQVTINLGSWSPVFAVAIETPKAADAQGRCESVEARWFSVYVHLVGAEMAACRTNVDPKGPAEDEGWCLVGSFEYRCENKPALQVFCLDVVPKVAREPQQWTSSGSAACWTGKGWHTHRLRIVLKDNWGAPATRVRRLRVLTFP